MNPTYEDGRSRPLDCCFGSELVLLWVTTSGPIAGATSLHPPAIQQSTWSGGPTAATGR
jgi:hypothetical protein